MTDYTIINADVGNKSGKITQVLYNTMSDVSKLVFNYDDNSAIWKKYVPEDLYLTGVDGKGNILNKNSTNVTIAGPFLSLIKSPNAGTSEDKNQISRIGTSLHYGNLNITESDLEDGVYYPSCSIIDNYGYILGYGYGWADSVSDKIKLNNKTYSIGSDSVRNIQYLFNSEYTSKVVKVPWTTGNENISYIEDSGSNINVIQTLVYYPQSFVNEGNITDFKIQLYDYESGTRSEDLTSSNISDLTNEFITSYNYTVNPDNTSLTLTFTCSKNYTSEYRDAFIIVTYGMNNCTSIYLVQEPKLLTAQSRVNDYEGSVYYLSADYSEILGFYNNRQPCIPNYQGVVYAENHGITDFSGIFSVGHVFNSRIFTNFEDGNRQHYLSDLGVKSNEMFIAIPDPDPLGVVDIGTDHSAERTLLNADITIKWANVPYKIYYINNSPTQTYIHQ